MNIPPSFRGRFAVRRLRLIAALAVVSLAGACGDNGGQPPSTGTLPPNSRLAWLQAAPSAGTAQGYRFTLFVDGAGNPLSSVSCAGESSPYDCSARLPSLTPGRHVLELSATDAAIGAESLRSAPLVVGAQPQTAATATDDAVLHPVAEEADVGVPSVTCASGNASLCFAVTLSATGLSPVRRLVALPDDRMLLLHENGHLTFLPSGVSEPLELGRFEPDAVVEFSDVAVDPHFDSNRFLYFATVVTAPGRERRMDVFRAREIAERVGEAAMIVSLPASPAGYPAMSAGPDERLYVAMPAEAGAATGRHPSDGRLLRFTRDGASAGHERSGSPILGIGSSKPTSLAWNSEARLLVASDDRVEHRLAAVALSQFSRSSVWPVTAFPVVNADAAFQGGLRALAVGRRSAGQTGDETLFIVGTDPQALYLATLASETQVELTSLRPVPLGPFSPAAAAVAAGGDLFIAGTLGDAASETGVLHLRYR